MANPNPNKKFFSSETLYQCNLYPKTGMSFWALSVTLGVIIAEDFSPEDTEMTTFQLKIPTLKLG